MTSKKHFKGLVKASEKKLLDEKARGLEFKVREKVGIAHIPPAAFSSLYNMPHYDYLKNGLYVKKTKDCADTLRNVACELRPDKHTREGYLLDMNYVKALEYMHDAQAHMLTPAEYFCTLSWINMIEEDQMLKDMTIEFDEFLDGIVRMTEDKSTTYGYRYELLFHNRSDGKGIIPGTVTEIPENMKTTGEMFSRFNTGNVDSWTGLPEGCHPDGNHTLHFKIHENNLDEKDGERYSHKTVERHTYHKDGDLNRSAELKIARRPEMMTASTYARFCWKVKEEEIIHGVFR